MLYIRTVHYGLLLLPNESGFLNVVCVAENASLFCPRFTREARDLRSTPYPRENILARIEEDADDTDAFLGVKVLVW